MEPRAPKLVIGIGNVLRGDDGVGVEVVLQLARLPVPSDVEIHEAGTVGPDLGMVLEDRQLVVVIDAIDAGGPPGAVYRLSPEQVRSAADVNLSVHDLHLLDALAETQLLGRAPEQVVILAVQVADTSVRMGLSEPVRRAVPRVVAMAARQVGMVIGHSRPAPGRADQSPSEPFAAQGLSMEVLSWH